MGTRCVLAIPTSPKRKSWKGRYSHWDGYPTSILPSLFTFVQRDGLERTIEVLTTLNYGWSTIDPTAPAKFDPEGEPGSYMKFFQANGRPRHTDPGHGDGRFKIVEGYGVAYTDTDVGPAMGEAHYQQVTADEWEFSTGGKDSWCEWAYVMHPEGVDVYENHSGWNLVGTLAWDLPPEAVKAFAEKHA